MYRKCRHASHIKGTLSRVVEAFDRWDWPAISFADRINIGASFDTTRGRGREGRIRYFNARLWYDNAPVHGIMYIGSCMIIWRDKAALSRHKLNRFSLTTVPLFLYRSPPTLSHSDHQKKRPSRRGTHLLHTLILHCTKETFLYALLPSYVRMREWPLKWPHHLLRVGTNVLLPRFLTGLWSIEVLPRKSICRSATRKIDARFHSTRFEDDGSLFYILLLFRNKR